MIARRTAALSLAAAVLAVTGCAAGSADPGRDRVVSPVASATPTEACPGSSCDRLVPVPSPASPVPAGQSVPGGRGGV